MNLLKENKSLEKNYKFYIEIVLLISFFLSIMILSSSLLRILFFLTILDFQNFFCLFCSNVFEVYKLRMINRNVREIYV